jgi:hypothetical protein
VEVACVALADGVRQVEEDVPRELVRLPLSPGTVEIRDEREELDRQRRRAQEQVRSPKISIVPCSGSSLRSRKKRETSSSTATNGAAMDSGTRTVFSVIAPWVESSLAG